MRCSRKAQWIEARCALLAEEKAWTRERDRLSEKRRRLPWVKVDKNYVFEGEVGPVALGCPGCSLVSDHVDGARRHFEHNDVSFVAVSRGPIEKLQAYRKRMGWTFRWVSPATSDFNFDYHVSFPKVMRERGVFYNFEQRPEPEVDELRATSVFHKDDDGMIYHTYSTYGRGGEMFLAVYGWLDVVPKGDNETRRGNLTDWVRRRDRYENERDGRPRPAIPATADAFSKRRDGGMRA
jgi:predicted dithiol-disulfide oxidoreductase (DUF899 family)